MQDLSEITSTIGIDFDHFNLAQGEVSVWDFAGQMEYTATHAFFLSVEVSLSSILFLSPLPHSLPSLLFIKNKAK